MVFNTCLFEFKNNSNVGKESKYELVENQETLQNLKLMLVRHGSADFVVEFRVCEGLNCLKTLIRKCRPFRRKSVNAVQK